jgi:hypothetical protein
MRVVGEKERQVPIKFFDMSRLSKCKVALEWRAGDTREAQ